MEVKKLPTVQEASQRYGFDSWAGKVPGGGLSNSPVFLQSPHRHEEPGGLQSTGLRVRHD